MIENIKRWLMKIFKVVEQVVPELSANQTWYDQFISKYKEIYSGYYEEWHLVKTRNGSRRMNTMQVAKLLCSEASNLVFTEKVSIVIDDTKINNYVNEVLENNKFSINQSELYEYMFALGGGVNSVRREDGKTVVDYTTADMFIPSKWTNAGIKDGIILTVTNKGKYIYTLVARYSFANGTNRIDYTLFRQDEKSDADSGTPVNLNELYPGMVNPVIITDCERPLFSYVKPNIGNNVDMNTPLGISIYGNSLDTIKSLDVCFDSFQREFVLGRKRIVVPAHALQVVTDPQTGAQYRYFDSEVDVYEGINVDSNDPIVKDDTQVLRIDEHIAAINAFLNILCIQCGFSPGFISFDAKGGLKTATEVVSENSKTYRTKVNHEQAIRQNIEELVASIIDVGSMYSEVKKKKYKIEIKFDDSIIEDKTAERLRDQMEVGMGLMSKDRFLEKWSGLDEADLTKEKNLLKGTAEEE